MANIYEKLQTMRVELQKLNIKKTGKNTYSNYDYYELGDVLPPINDLMAKHKVCSFITYTNEMATLTLVNAEKPEEMIMFTSPMAEVTLKAAHAIQNLGAVETYQRRYLYLTAFEIVEHDFFDATQGKEQPKAPTQRKQAPKPAPAAKLSKENGEGINGAIKYLNEAYDMPIKEVRKRIETYMKKPINMLTDTDYDKVISFLNSLAAEEEPF